MLRRHVWRAMSHQTLGVVLRKVTTASAELTAVYIISTLFLLVVCLGCGVYRNRRRDAEDLRSIHRAHLTTAIYGNSIPAEARIPGRTPLLHSFTPDKDVADAPCPICLEPLGTIPTSKGLCGHALHTDCLVQWLVRDPHFSCPVCRSTYETVSRKQRCSVAATEETVISRCSENQRSEVDSHSDEVLQDGDHDDSFGSVPTSPTHPRTANNGDVVLPMGEDSESNRITDATSRHRRLQIASEATLPSV